MRPTLLLADDSVTIQRVIELTFADEDIEVVTAGDGDEAIARINGSPPDIVLVDVGMPGRNGYEVARYVKRSPMLSHIPVILLVGAFEPIDQRRAEEAGCDGVLAKPFEPKLVIGKVKELLGGARGRTRPQRQTATVVDIRPGDAGAPAQMAAPASENIDDYFDRLDHAFTQLSASQTGHGRSGRDSGQPPSGSGSSDLAPLPATDRPHESHVASRETVEPVSARVTLPSLPEAFAALLSAERTAGRPQFGPQWSSPAVARETPSVSLSDELVEKAAQRVVEQVSAQSVREVVTDIVSSVAERLVREEIARLRSSVS